MKHFIPLFLMQRHRYLSIYFCCCSVVQLCPILPSNGLHHARSLSFTSSLNLLKLMSIESVMPSNYFILCCPLLLLPSVFPTIRVFSNESALCIRWPKYWSFSFSISPPNEYSGLISFRIDWFDLHIDFILKMDHDLYSVL